MKSSAMNKPDERVVCLALRSVFTGEDAKVRSSKAIKKQIQIHAHRPDVQALMQSHHQEHVYQTAKNLLVENVFGSSLRAKIRFPEVFSTSPAQSAEREHSEEEAARSEAHAIRNAAEGHSNTVEANSTNRDAATEGHGFKSLGSQERNEHYSELRIPSLYPIYVPFQTQHRLTNKIQKVLEDACFTFAQEHLGAELRKNGWECTEQVELNVWTRTFKSARCLDETALTLRIPLSELFESIADLRHTAVHRIQVSVNRLLQFLADAEALATLLNNDHAADYVARQRGRLEVLIDETKRNNDILRYRAAETIRELNDRIADIRKLQEEAIESMLRDDRDFRQSIVVDLETAMDLKSSKQREAPGEECATSSTAERMVESSSDVEIECEKHYGALMDSP
ncbi:hypothetical protein BAUCODRAFT_134403 [Baudoinia panamericana UAMH 10762]|uniref:Ubiquinol-cytochrome-c reductase cytochrome c1 n=1 Tax=Baudoinia panamericana (strain UAMH 10762) TaxID=717646 RepID=M2M4M9_BAUPA|nr:uncharacterized protein BAUCODRAFT_134403 [Baudoinia panamericana UAMH 10762]EMC91556.1 hypothetical protein BAUCODRAFT_134403 [Baudoinia panamericana UAMH 10762]